MDKVVADWNKANPNIQVELTKIAGGEPGATKFLTAIKAGKGAPDIMLAEYQKIPTFVAANALADISKDVSPDLKTQYPDATWNSVTLGTSALYAIPQNSGPMLFFYRTDVFQRLGLTPPATWDDYAKDAQIVHNADKTTYIGNFSTTDGGRFAGLAQQNGAAWWSNDGSAWSVGIDQTPTQKVAAYWGDLVSKDLVKVQGFSDPEFFTDLNSGRVVGLIAGAWAPAVFAPNVPGGIGKWKAAPLPQWSATDSADGTWGGAALAVSSQSAHPAEAAKFLEWMNASNDGLTSLIKGTGGLYLSNTKYGPAVLASPPPYFSNQADYWQIAGAADKSVKSFAYGPNVDAAYNAFGDQFAKATQAKTVDAFASALTAMQKATVADLTSNGFTVK